MTKCKNARCPMHKRCDNGCKLFEGLNFQKCRQSEI